MAASSFAMPGGPVGKSDCESRHGQKTQAERMEQRAKHMTELKAKLKLRPDQETAMLERALATKAFYAQLTPEQQSVFDAEAMPKRGHWGQGQHHHQS